MSRYELREQTRSRGSRLRVFDTIRNEFCNWVYLDEDDERRACEQLNTHWEEMRGRDEPWPCPVEKPRTGLCTFECSTQLQLLEHILQAHTKSDVRNLEHWKEDRDGGTDSSNGTSRQRRISFSDSGNA